MTGPRPQTVRAYSLVEMIVVISIIALLLALAGIGINSVVNSRRVSATQLTMQTLETAISEFEKDGPLSNRGDPSTGDPDESFPYISYFGDPASGRQRPPSPVVPLGLGFPPGSPLLNESIPAQAGVVSSQFTKTVKAYMRGPNPPNPTREGMNADNTAVVWSDNPVDPTKDFASIECLVLFLTQLSPGAKSWIDKLPESCKGNEDRDYANLVGGRVGLIEIKDAWDKPMRYSVKPPDRMAKAFEKAPSVWELRSAGKDGVFSPPFFTPADRSDDVVWPKGSSR